MEVGGGDTLSIEDKAMLKGQCLGGREGGYCSYLSDVNGAELRTATEEVAAVEALSSVGGTTL